MKRILIAGLVALALAASGTTQAAPARTSCSDLAYLNAAVKSGKKNIVALRLAQKKRWSAALAPAQTALWFIKRSAVPCDRDGDQYWLHRQYSIRYAVALVRWIEESRDGDALAADTYWSSVEFWGDEIHDIQLGW